MKRGNIQSKNLLSSIRRSLGRYIAIIVIIALGASIFVGLRTTKADMVATGQKYMDEQNMFDLRLLSTYGWDLTDVEKIAALEGVAEAEGVWTLDALARRSDRDAEGVYKFYALPEKLDKVLLQGGRMPENPDECLLDGHYSGKAAIGATITVLDENSEDTLSALKYKTFTVVGYVSTPLYMDMNRGTTTIGNGSVSAYVYLPRESFDLDYYTEIHVTIPGDYTVYTEAFDDAMDTEAEILKPLLAPIAQARYENVRSDAEQQYQDGLAEYEQGLQDYNDGKKEAEAQLADAKAQLDQAEATLEANEVALESGKEALSQGQDTLLDSSVTLSQSRQALAEAKAEAYAQITEATKTLYDNYKTVSQNQRQVESGLVQVNAGLAQLNSGISQLETGLQQLDVSIQVLDTLMKVMDTSVQAAQAALDQAVENGVSADTIASLQQKLDDLKAKQTEYQAKLDDLKAQQETYSAQLEELKEQKTQVEAQKAELEAAQSQLSDAMDQIDAGFAELDGQKAEMEAQFAAAEAQLEAGQAQLDSGKATIDKESKTLTEGEQALQKARTTLEEKKQEYEDGKAESERQLAEAKAKLDDAKSQLDEARETIDSMSDPEVYVLTRNTNMGYLSLDSNSDIVQGVSRVFPVFFLLVAALVCITTMTRMVEEERTQIGTMKALGYTNREIIRKYLLYSGSAALLGCTLGIALGCVVFPIILWNAYSIILNLTSAVTLVVDWGLCIPVAVIYILVSLAVTWYCCRRTLEEVPAELIRPKPPTSGKKILLEYLPFWKNISFLNKVMLRNVFRYRQRLLMMLVGIGGCTALLLTGFGLGDSIKNIVSFQYEEVTKYDIEARFTDGQDESAQEAFRTAMADSVSDVCFLYQSSMALDFGGKTKDVTMLVGGSGLGRAMDFHRDSESIPLPKDGEVLLSIGIAKKMGIGAGDTVTLRSSDMQTLTLTVSGIFDNDVYNYAIVSPETLAAQWGSTPESQVAYVTLREGQDAHQTASTIAKRSGVMSVTVNKDVAEQVRSMLQAMDLVIAVVVICAGLLAVTVLYNLTNINITERLREIATIKVLGFNARETAAYVFKENFLLTGMGVLLGLGGGWALLSFVMSQIQIDMVWFTARLLPLSYVLSVVLTFLAAVLVDGVLYFKLDRINMAEALKSVE